METHVYTKRYPSPVHRTILPNGAEVWTAPLKSRMVSFQITFPFGAYHDGPHKGIAHFLEHLMLPSTEEEGVTEALRDLMWKGVRTHAGTNWWYTEFSIASLADLSAESFHALMDALRHPVFTPEQTEQERSVIFTEEQQRRSKERWNRWVFPRSFPLDFDPYIPIGGTPESIATITHDDILRHANHRMLFEDAQFLATGGITHDDHLRMVLAILPELESPRSRTSRRLPTIHTVVPSGEYTQSTIHAMPGIEFHFLPPPEGTPESVAFDLAIEALTNFPHGALYDILRNQRRLVYSIESGRRNRPLSGAHIEIPVATTHFNEVTNVVRDALRTVTSDGLPPRLHEKIQAQKRIFFAIREEGTTRGRYLITLQNDWLAEEFEDTDFETRWHSVTPELIRSVCATYLNPDKWGIVRCVPPDGK